MGAVQTSYTGSLAIGSAGQPAESITFDALSKQVETSEIPFGRAVIKGTAADQVAIGDDGIFIGIAVRDIGLDPTQGDKYVAGDTAAIMIRGSIFVTAGEAVAAGDPVYRTATGTLVKTATDNTLIAGAIWETAAGSGALARLRLG